MHKQDKGYTIPELIVVIVIVGIFSLVVINKASYAFVDTDELSSQTEDMILIKSATAYGNSILESLKNGDVYVSGKDLVEAEYLVDDTNVYGNRNIRLSYNSETNSVLVEILK